MGNQWSKNVKLDDINIDPDNIYADPYSFGYDEPYADTRVREQVQIYDEPNTEPEYFEDSSKNYGIENEAYISELQTTVTAIPTLDLFFIVQTDEKDCTLHNKKIFRLYLNRFSIESKKIDIQFKHPLFVDRNLDLFGTKQLIFDELSKWHSENTEKVQVKFKILIFETLLKIIFHNFDI